MKMETSLKLTVLAATLFAGTQAMAQQITL